MNVGAITGIAITILLFVGGFFVKKNKFYFVFQVLWIDLLIIGNNGSVDFFVNNSIFEDANESTIAMNNFLTKGYYYLAMTAKDLGMQYLMFNGILSTISLLLIAFVIFKMSNNPCIVISYFMLYPMIDCIIQKRWFIAMGLLVLAFYFLYLNIKNIWKIVIYIGLVTLACQIHSASLFFYSLVLFYFLPYKVKKIIAILGLILFSCFRGIIAKIGLSSTELGGKSQLYFVSLSSNSIIHYTFWLIWHLAFVGIIFYLCNKKEVKDIWSNSLINFIKTVNLWSLLIIPFYSFDPVFNRLFRVIIIFNYIMISNLFIVNDAKIKKIFFNSIMYQLCLCGLSFIVIYSIAGLPFDQLVLPIFQYNIFLNLL